MAQPVTVDASAVVEVLRGGQLGDRVAEAMHGTELVAPAHLDAEVLSALGRLARATELAPHAVERSLSRLTRMPIVRYPLAPLLRRAWDLRDNIALRDGLYIACAEAARSVLLTMDARLARSAPVAVTHIS
jgi:predicted nucleic acid-binding protein